MRSRFFKNLVNILLLALPFSIIILLFFLPGSQVILWILAPLNAIVGSFFLYHRVNEIKLCNTTDILEYETKRIEGLASSLVDFGSGNLVTQVDRFNKKELVADRRVNEIISRLDTSISSSIEEYNYITSTPCSRLCFTGNNAYEEGKIAGDEICRIMENQGTLMIMIPQMIQVNHASRAKSCINAIKERNTKINILPIVEGMGNEEIAPRAILEALKKYPKTNLIYITDGFTPQFVIKALKEKNLYGKQKIVSYDAIPENIALLNQGAFECLIEQSSFLQTYNSLIHLYNALEHNWTPISRKLHQIPLVINRQNVKEYWDFENNHRKMTESEKASMAVPEPKRTSKNYKIAVILPTVGGFFEGLERGAEAAQKVLKNYDVNIKMINGFDKWDNFGAASALSPYIKNLEKEGYHGYAISMFDRALVHHINESVNKGMKVATYNSEPLNFRELITNAIENIEELTKHSQDLAASAEESNMANQQIKTSIVTIESSVEEQQKQSSLYEKSLENLNQSLNQVNIGFQEYAQMIKEVVKEAEEGKHMIGSSYEAAKNVKQTMNQIDRSMNELNKKLQDIREITVTVEDFVSNTNVLAINASIQAARAGEAGKGFAVVANEVRHLAEQSTQAVEKIGLIINSTTESMNAALASLRASHENVESGNTQSHQASESFRHIVERLSNTIVQSDSLSQSINSISREMNKVNTVMDTVIDKNASNVESIEEIAKSIAELASNAADLSKTAQSLSDLSRSQHLLFGQLTIEEEETVEMITEI
ncbi:MAG: substrate-binding domain-containing protein [Spirochaetales bacterium]|nr:substrate-binding domain-containing protein [Spirochaetales bacterium]